MTDDFITLKYDPKNPPIISQKRNFLPKGMEWTLNDREGLWKLLLDESLKGNDWRVLTAIIADVEFGNFYTANQVELAEKLKMNQASVSRCLKKLLEVQAIAFVRKNGKHTVYQLNPYIAFKIACADYEKLIKDWGRNLLHNQPSSELEKPLEEPLPY